MNLKTLFYAALVLLPLGLAIAAPPDIAFKQKFKTLVEKGAKPAELEKTVKLESSAAAAWIARSTEILADRPDDAESAAFLTALSASWKGAMKSAFPEKEKEFFAALQGQNKKDRIDLRKRFDKCVSDFDANAQAKDGMTYANLVDEFELFANAFEQIGDFYYASESWIYHAACYDEPQRGPNADAKRTATGLEKAIAARAKVELADQRNDEAMKRKATLTKSAPKEGAPPPGKDDPGGPPSETGAAVTVPLTFEIVPSVDAYLRPIYTGDDLYLLWRAIRLLKNDSTGTFENNEKPANGPTFRRVGAADVRADVDQDGKFDGPADLKVPLTGNITPVKVMLGKGESARPWAFLAVTGTQQETFEGIQTNMAPTGEQLTIYTLSAASVVGTIDGTGFRAIDDSMDGVYGTLQSTQNSYGFDGLSKDHYQPELDCIVIGASKRARPWSEFQEIGGKWYKLEHESKGKEIKATPVRVDTGTLKLEFKGGVAPAWVVVRGQNEMKDSFFDLVEGGGKGVNVPVGHYTLFYGEIRKGKKKQMQKIVILPPKNAQSVEVSKGGTTTLTLGAPYVLEFKNNVIDGKLTVEGKSIVVVGSQGERYERPWQCVVRPELGWRKKGQKQASKYQKMGALQDTDAITKYGWAAAWFPLDAEIDVKGQGDVEAQIVDKKHPLFGSVESEWK